MLLLIFLSLPLLQSGSVTTCCNAQIITRWKHNLISGRPPPAAPD